MCYIFYCLFVKENKNYLKMFIRKDKNNCLPILISEAFLM